MGDPGSIPGLRKTPGEANSNPLQYSSEKAMAPHSSTLAWKIPWTESLVGCSPWGLEQLDMTEWLHFHFHFHALEKEMATHSSVLVWRIPGTEEPSGLPSMGSHRVGHDWSDLAAVASTLAWEISRTKEPGGLQSMGSQRVRHNWVTNAMKGLWKTLEMLLLSIS